MGNRKLTCTEVREWDMVQYLSGLGFEPQKIKGNNYWYCSPLRNENTPSFKIDISRNRWKDFGHGNGGSLIDFGILYFNCSVGDFLKLLEGDFSFQRLVLNRERIIGARADKIVIKEVLDLQHPALLQYLQSRSIPFALAKQYCSQVHYENGGRPFFAVGFRNDNGGYELRSRFFKGSSAPKTLTLFGSGNDNINVFEGFTDFLSHLVLFPGPIQTDYLVLNSLSFLEKALPVLSGYTHIRLFLDHNPAGREKTRIAKAALKSCIDSSSLYTGFEDLNDYLCNKPMIPADKPP
ncbi:toprim domain-containing protein [Mucilaginibacter sp. UC70_90]